jgi:phosphate transport system substrate-binding protein
MKNKQKKSRSEVNLVASILAVFTFFLVAFTTPEKPKPALKGTITITGTRFLFPLLEKWAAEFKKQNPGVEFVIKSGVKEYDINASAAPLNPQKLTESNYTVVSKFGLVPIVNEKNPALSDLQQKGISRQDFLNIYFSGENKTNSFNFASGKQVPIHVYSRGACASATFTKHFGKEIKDLTNTGGKIEDDKVLLESVVKDSLGIAYNNLGFVYDLETRKQKEGVRVIPIDLNENGKIDQDENFYSTIDELIEKLEKSKSDLPPTGNHTFIYKTEIRPEVKAFIDWVSKEGQQYTQELGFLRAGKTQPAGQAQSKL